MTEALPIGNGRLGGMVFGDPAAERIVLNDISLWTGDANPSGDVATMGAYQCLATLHVDLPGHQAATAYRRDLDLATAVASVGYRVGDVTYRREHFASHPAGVVVSRLTADRPGSYTGRITLADAHAAATRVDDGQLVAVGTLSNGLAYETRVSVVGEGGSVRADSDAIELVGCDSVTLIVSAGTNYAMDPAHGFRGDAPHAGVIERLRAAVATPYDRLRAEHVADYRALFDRVSLDLGPSADDVKALPTDVRKIKAAAGGDPELEALLFQFGRYLMISSSRPGSLPANLQGLWNDSNTPPWGSDYHSNINVEMNYWPAEVTNLAECHTPFFDLIRSQIPEWRKVTAAAPDMNTPDGRPTARGFAVRTSHNTTGGMGWQWDKTANAWYALHFWDHYAFGQDKAYLRDVAYPVLKEVTEFWLDHLKQQPDGKLVVPDAWSPEHGPHEDGVTYAQQIVDELLRDTVAAADVLGVDPDLRTAAATARAKLAKRGVGSWGQLLEWTTEKNPAPLDAAGLAKLSKYDQFRAREDAMLDSPDDHHRHTSHLFGVYPGHSISVAATPELAKAARVSLLARGDFADSDVREWSFAWRCALWARLLDGDAAHGQLLHLLDARNTCPNLFGLHPPMQIDGNFGITAAIAEMLLQSQDDGLDLLPALPAAWPNGRVRGLRARGGITVDLQWQGGRLSAVTLLSAADVDVTIRYGQRSTKLRLIQGRTTTLTADLTPAA